MILAAAMQALARNKMRSALTMLGVFIGVAALIAMVAIGQGANDAVKQAARKPRHQPARRRPGCGDEHGRPRRSGQRLDSDRYATPRRSGARTKPSDRSPI